MRESELAELLKNPHISVNEQHAAGAGAISRPQPCDAKGQYRKAAVTRSGAVVATEHEEQVSFWQYVETAIIPRYPEAAAGYAIPNGARTSAAQAGKLKAEGLRAGVSDICFPIARGGYHGLYIEMKRRSGGQVSPEQREFQRLLIAERYRAEICRGWEAAVQVLTEYLSGQSAYYENLPF